MKTRRNTKLDIRKYCNGKVKITTPKPANLETQLKEAA